MRVSGTLVQVASVDNLKFAQRFVCLAPPPSLRSPRFTRKGYAEIARGLSPGNVRRRERIVERVRAWRIRYQGVAPR